MKKAPLVTLVCLVALVASCRHDVDLYGSYRQIPVIYCLLDAKADTNFAKVTRVFYAQNDALQVAVNPDSSNYPGRLDVRLTEFCNGVQTRVIVLDTITIGNKQPGTFYAPKQKLYYTTEPLGRNTAKWRYSYQLSVALPDSTIHTHADLVGSTGFKAQSLAVNFSKEYFGRSRPFYFLPALNADFYQVELTFSFKERRTPDGDSVLRTMQWHVADYDDYYLSTHMEGEAYVFTYRPEHFYISLRDFLGDDTLTDGVVRFIGDYPIHLRIHACGKNLRHYMYLNNPLTGISPGDVEFTLIDGGYGVFSSRMTMTQKLRLGGSTVPELIENKYWGFRFMGGDWANGSAEP